MAEKKVTKRLTTIVSVDVAGYSRLMEADEAGTLEALKAHRAVTDPKIGEYGGRIVGTAGDGLLVEYPSVSDAVSSALEVQALMAERNADVPADKRIEFRIGINLGDVIIEDDDIFGTGVNVAARLQELADPGGICVSRSVFNQVKAMTQIGFADLGPQRVKNITEPVPAYKVLLDPSNAGRVLPKKRAVRIRSRLGAGLAAAAIVLVAAVAGYSLWPRDDFCERKTVLAVPAKPSIAVLPFNNLSGDPSQDAISDGLTEDIITTLAKLSNLFVIARNSVFTYKGKAVKVQQVAKDLGVRYILEGSVQRAGGRRRITAQLIDARTGRHLWAERYDRDTGDLFAAKDEIVTKIRTALQVELTEGEQARIWSRQTDNLEAYLLVHRSVKEFQKFNKESNAKALALAQRAVKLDADYVTAWVMLSWAHVVAADYGGDRSKAIRMGAKYAAKAIELDAKDPDAIALLGYLALMRGNSGKAVELGRKAVTLGPNNGDVHALLGLYLNAAGRPKEAVPMIKQAMRLSPYYPTFYLSQLGGAYFRTGRYEEAIIAFRKLVCRSPDHMYARLNLALSYGMLGRRAEARKAVAELRRVQPNFSLASFKRINKTRPFSKTPAGLKRHLDILRKAGLPEK